MNESETHSQVLKRENDALRARSKALLALVNKLRHLPQPLSDGLLLRIRTNVNQPDVSQLAKTSLHGSHTLRPFQEDDSLWLSGRKVEANPPAHDSITRHDQTRPNVQTSIVSSWVTLPLNANVMELDELSATSAKPTNAKNSTTENTFTQKVLSSIRQ